MDGKTSRKGKSGDGGAEPGMQERGDRILRISEVMRLTSLSRSTIYHKVKTGEFPVPVHLFEGGRAKGWWHSEIMAWLRSRRRVGKDGQAR